MMTFYIILLVLISLVINVSVTLAMPYVKHYWNAFITRIKRKLNTRKSKPQQVIDATQYLELSSRIDDIEKRLNKRQSNVRWVIKEEIKNILLELKNE